MTTPLPTREQIAATIAKAHDADYWVDEIRDWDAQEEWEKAAHPDEEPFSAYEDRDYFLVAADAVLKLLQQPRIVPGMRVRYPDSGRERIVGEFVDGAWDLLIPGTEKSRMAVEPEVFWDTVELVSEHPEVKDMPPGAEFFAQHRAGGWDRFTVIAGENNNWLRGDEYEVSMPGDLDLSTVQDVKLPKEDSND